MTRRSVRAFQDLPVDRVILEKIILAASHAPSYSNTQPWETAVVLGEKKKDLIQRLYQAAKARRRARPDLPFPRVWPKEMRKRASLHDYEARQNQFLQNFLFFGAPVAIIIYTERRLGPWSTFDLGLFVQNLVLSAHSMGLATCIEAMPVAYPRIIAKCLGIPASKKIVVALALGYEDKSAPINQYRSERKPIEEWVKWF
jgi:nitroreductase